MTVRLGDIVIDCRHPTAAAEFWCAALGYRVVGTDETGVAIAGDSSAPTLLFLASSDLKAHKNRIHFDVCPVEGTTRDDEVARLERLGASRIDIGQHDASWVVMVDPDGNEFCVMNTVLPPEPAPFHHQDQHS
jgi:catechol 2,3-dioxygenase-like lactoylglutathione lyase family enzyme